MQVDRDAPLRFLRAAFLPDDWIAVLLKRRDSGEAVQRVGPLAMVLDSRFQAWLRFKNARRFDVFVSINALTPGRRSRTRESVTAVRHVFLDADKDADRVLAAIGLRSNLPAPSCVVRSSKGRAHVLWRVDGVSVERAETLQKQLARELGTDLAATSAAQMTRLSGFFNHKYKPPPLVEVLCADRREIFTPESFPRARPAPGRASVGHSQRASRWDGLPMAERARRYLAATPPAVQGQRGDATTFRLCRRLVRMFALADDDLLQLLSTWNARCQPPWSDRDLLDKLRRSRRQVVAPRRASEGHSERSSGDQRA